MRKLFLSLLVLLCVTTTFGYNGVHVTPHVTPHVSVHTTPHVSSYHSTPHTYTHVSEPHTYTHSTSRIRPIYHPNGYYYHVIMNNSAHRNDTIKADSEEDLNRELETREIIEEDNDTRFILILCFILGIVFLGFIALITDF